MKRLLATLLTITSLFVTGGWSNPSDKDKESDFDLINYLETHEVSSYREFTDIIEKVSPELTNESGCELDVVSFDIEIDYDNRIVEVTTIFASSLVKAHGVYNNASKTYYSDVGTQIFKITVEGTFSYSTGACNVISKGGSFTKPAYSFWSSTPNITSGNINATKAYVKISGMASGAGISKTYSLTLTCNDSGQFSSY